MDIAVNENVNFDGKADHQKKGFVFLMVRLIHYNQIMLNIRV